MVYCWFFHSMIILFYFCYYCFLYNAFLFLNHISGFFWWFFFIYYYYLLKLLNHSFYMQKKKKNEMKFQRINIRLGLKDKVCIIYYKLARLAYPTRQICQEVPRRKWISPGFLDGFTLAGGIEHQYGPKFSYTQQPTEPFSAPLLLSIGKLSCL